jgi:hypothetical protein
MFGPAECSRKQTAHYLRIIELHMQCVCPLKPWRSKVKTIVAALALLSLATGPVFAAGSPSFGTMQPGYYVNPNSPALTGGGSLGHNRLQQEF